MAAMSSFVEFAHTLSPTDWATPVPCTPAWTVRDVLSHVSGIPDDALAARMGGAPGEAWTASQVERYRDVVVEDLLDRWVAQAPAFAETIEQMGERRPPFDAHSHEHDIRQALGRPGNRSSDVVVAAALGLASIDDAPVELRVDRVDGVSTTSGDPASDRLVTVTGLTSFEVFRSRLGRRSRGQVRRYQWTGDDADIEAVIDGWFVFGPSITPIVE